MTRRPWAARPSTDRADAPGTEEMPSAPDGDADAPVMEPTHITIHRPRRRRRRGLGALVALPVALGLIGASAVVWESSSAAFTATTSNAANSWAAGTVSLTDDDSATAMFSATGLVPAATGSKCITVTYGGSAAAAVKFYVAANTGPGLQPYLDLVIQEGSGGSFGSCTGFTPTSTLFTGTLSALVSANATYATGLSSWAPTGAAQSRTYKVSYTLNASTPDAQQGASSTATFQWEARST